MPTIVQINGGAQGGSITKVQVGSDISLNYGSNGTKTFTYTISATDIPNYNNLTADNFSLYVTGGCTSYDSSGLWSTGAINSHSVSYDSSTGVATITISLSSQYGTTTGKAKLYCHYIQ